MARASAPLKKSALRTPKLSPKLAALAKSPCQSVKPADSTHSKMNVMTKGLSLMGKSNLEKGFSAAQTLTRSIS
jgi:hypothetical protein